MRTTILAIALAVAAPEAAAALGIAPDPIPIDVAIDAAPPALPEPITITGEIAVLGFETGLPTGGTVHSGAVDPADTTLLVQVSLTTALFGTTPTPISDIELNTGGLPTPSACGSLPGTGDVALSSGCFFSPGLFGGQTSDVIFFSFPRLDPGDSLTFLSGDILTLELGEAIVTVPEPAVPWLLAMAGTAMAATLRRGWGAGATTASGS